MQKNCSCRFLYGADTSEHVAQQMVKALEGREEYQAEVHFYKKNGGCTAKWACNFYMAACSLCFLSYFVVPSLCVSLPAFVSSLHCDCPTLISVTCVSLTSLLHCWCITCFTVCLCPVCLLAWTCSPLVWIYFLPLDNSISPVSTPSKPFMSLEYNSMCLKKSLLHLLYQCLGPNPRVSDFLTLMSRRRRQYCITSHAVFITVALILKLTHSFWHLSYPSKCDDMHEEYKTLLKPF